MGIAEFCRISLELLNEVAFLEERDPMQQLTATWTRRGWITSTSTAIATLTATGWLKRIANATEQSQRPIRSCLLLWMNGGPSQTDTFDLKPGHENGGPFHPIQTSAPGVVVSEHLPKVAQWMHRLSIIRSMSTREGDHGRARDHLRTGYLPQAAIEFPVLGSLVSHEWGPQADDLPNYVSILPRGLFRPGSPPSGFLGSQDSPLLVGGGAATTNTPLRVENLAAPGEVTADQFRERMALLKSLESQFLDARPGQAADSYRDAYSRSVRLMSPTAAKAFELEQESVAVRQRYGSSSFGQGCLLARRLLERRVPFVEVTLGGWDTHNDNFNAVKELSTTLDQGWSSLLADLDERGLLDSTLVVWMGEFGRTPTINPQQGRDHYPKAWSVVLGGGGIRGGSIIGSTTPDGMEVADRPVSTPDLLATICLALGIDPKKQNMSNVDRPIRIVDPVAQPISKLVASPT